MAENSNTSFLDQVQSLAPSIFHLINSKVARITAAVASHDVTGGANNNMKGGTRSYRDFTGAVYGNLTIIGFLGGRRSKEMWLAKCLCGYYTKRRDKTLRKKRNNSFDYCPDCEARDQAQARYAFQATGIYRLLKTDPNAAKEDAVRRRRDRLTVPSDKS